MIVIVGRKIVLHKGDDEAFRVILRDKKGNDISLSDTNVITLRMNYSMETEEPITYRKTAKVVKLNDDKDIYHIISFSSKDTKDLPSGDYNYDVILENYNKRFTVVPTSILTLEDSISYEDIENNDDDIQIFDADENIDYESIIASTPLIGSFPEVDYTKVSGVIDDEIILF